MSWEGQTQVKLVVWKPALEVGSGLESGAMKLLRNSKIVPLLYANRHSAVVGTPVGRVYSAHGVVHIEAKAPSQSGGFNRIGREIFAWTVNAQQMRITTHTSTRVDKVLPRLDERTKLFDTNTSFAVAGELVVEQMERFANPLVAEFTWLQFKPVLRQAWNDAHALLEHSEWDGPRPEDALVVAEQWDWPAITVEPENVGAAL